MRSAAGCLAFGGYTNGCMGYLPTAAEHAAGGYEVEWSPLVYRSYEGFLMAPVADTADDVVLRAAELVETLALDSASSQRD